MKQTIFSICFLILICYPVTACSSKDINCDQASRVVKKEMWTGNQSTESIENAIKICLVSADGDDAVAQYNLSVLYTLKNNKIENEKTYEWALKAAKNGHAYSQFHLGTMYEKGTVVTQDIEKAYEWYKKAAENGLLPAQKKVEEIRAK